MPEYPNITDKDFYEKINKIYKNFKIKKKNTTLEDICFPKEYKLQLPQKFISNFISPNTEYMGVMVYHKIGAGKTCAGIQTAEGWKKYKRIIVVVPASLKGNFRNELRSMCAGESYLKNSERKILEKLHPTDKKYKEIIEKSDKRINEFYEIYSYNKFIELLKEKKINLKNALLLIDEIQNMVSEGGSFYSILYDAIHSAPKDLRIVLLSATPMFDKPNEIALTMNLLRPKVEFPVGKDFDKTFINMIKSKKNGNTYTVKNINLFKKLCKGYISYFRGAPPIVFPAMKIKYVKCEMSNFQYNAYKKVLGNEENTIANMSRENLEILGISDLPNNFYIGTRVISNVVFPNNKINESGFLSFTNNKITNDLNKYSCKFSKIMEKIQKCKGKIFVYSSFKEYGGIKSFAKVLMAFGWKNYTEAGEGKKRFAIWSGDENVSVKEQIRTIYNMKNNLKGSKLKIILGSPSIREGVSLYAVRQVHVIEPYWNQSRFEQVIGRASRFCSHKDLDLEQRNVKVYVYIAVPPETNKKTPITVDEYIQRLSIEKDKIIKTFEKGIKESAIDCELNKNANVYEGEEDFKCE
jgi:superfamily II DNA or RNA helicase